MGKRYEIKAEQAAEIADVRKGIRDKNVDRRLRCRGIYMQKPTACRNYSRHKKSCAKQKILALAF